MFGEQKPRVQIYLHNKHAEAFTRHTTTAEAFFFLLGFGDNTGSRRLAYVDLLSAERKLKVNCKMIVAKDLSPTSHRARVLFFSVCCDGGNHAAGERIAAACIRSVHVSTIDHIIPSLTVSLRFPTIQFSHVDTFVHP